jgi:DNA-binding transcriptional regulator YhcF (GntR family)
MLSPQDLTALPLYRQLAAHYQQAMSSGSLRPGMPLPSVRELHRRHTVSLSTALQTLRYLEEQGLIEARQRVGYFVRQPQSPVLRGLGAVREPDLRAPLAPDPQLFAGINERISVILEKARRAAPLRVDLGSAMPAPSLFDAPSINQPAGCTAVARAA